MVALMKKFMGLVLGLVMYQCSFADCMPFGIRVVNDTRTLTKNGILIIEFYAESQTYVPGLGNKYPVYLRSKTASVLLQPVEILKGEMGLTEVVFRPTGDLAVSDIYELQIDNLPQQVQRYNSQQHAPEPYLFTIAGTTFQTLPLLNKLPVETKNTMAMYGCGPERLVYFSIDASEGVKYVRAKVKSVETGKEISYIILIGDRTVMIGHSMCSGQFHFNDGKNYTVRFSPIDADGNEGQLSEAIGFKRPEMEDDISN